MAQFLVTVKPQAGLTPKPQPGRGQQMANNYKNLKGWVHREMQSGDLAQAFAVAANQSGIVAVFVVNANNANDVKQKGAGNPVNQFYEVDVQPLTNLQQQTAGLTLLDFSTAVDNIAQEIPKHFQ